MNKQKMPAEIGKLFRLLYDGESEVLVRIAIENSKKQRANPEEADCKPVNLEGSTNIDDLCEQ